MVGCVWGCGCSEGCVVRKRKCWGVMWERGLSKSCLRLLMVGMISCLRIGVGRGCFLCCGRMEN